MKSLRMATLSGLPWRAASAANGATLVTGEAGVGGAEARCEAENADRGRDVKSAVECEETCAAPFRARFAIEVAPEFTGGFP